jgi:hypothetical protein
MYLQTATVEGDKPMRHDVHLDLEKNVYAFNSQETRYATEKIKILKKL